MIINNKTRICKTCNIEFPIEEFNTNGFKSNGERKYHLACKKCSTRDTMIRCLNAKKKAVEYLGGKCSNCGIDNLIVLEFHHLDPSKKEAVWGNMKRWGWERMKIELDKCILLCANCHVIEHAIFFREINLNTNSYIK